MFWKINPQYYHYHIHPRYLEINPISFVWEKFKNLIIFIDENILGIIFSIFILYVLFYLLFRLPHNLKIIKKYKRENGNNDIKFITQRCKEDGDEKGRHYVYLINTKDKTYQWLEDEYTIKRLGYGYASRKENLFSNKEYTIKERIKIYNIISDIKNILKFRNDF